jgi:hypothetical protein
MESFPKKIVGKKSRKEKTGPKGPKRALSAYMYFAQSVRPSIKEQQPELTFGELTKLVATRWSNATIEEKAPFEKLAADDKQRYLNEKVAANTN